MLEIFLSTEIPVRQRAALFLEIFGNAKVQERTSRYIEEIGRDLRSLVTNERGRMEGLIDFSMLKYRDRDDLENAFKSYSKANPFDTETLRDHRLRGYYAERYDSRLPLADWDWHAAIKPFASIIHVRQFKDWRLNGIAYEFGDQAYTDPNRTMMSYTEGFLKTGKDKGLKKEVKGFWADIVSSPYFSFGIDCEVPNKFAEGLFEIYNKGTGTEQHRHNTAEVAVYSLISMLFELETGRQYKMTREHDIYSGLGSATEIEAEEEPRVVELPDIPFPAAHTSSETLSSASALKVSAPNPPAQELVLPNFQVLPMLGLPSSLKVSSKLPAGHFDAIFVSSRGAQWISSPEANALLKPGGLVAVETAKFLVPLNGAQKTEFNRKVDEYASGHGWSKAAEGPVFRRRRDENDPSDDVTFFLKPLSEAV